MADKNKEPFIRNFYRGDIVESAKRSLEGEQWANFCIVHLVNFQNKYKEGDKFALLQTIEFCAQAEIKIPKWAANGYTEVFRQISDLEFKSLDEAFGVTYPKGKQLHAAYKKKKYQPSMYLEVLQASKDGLPIGYGPLGAYAFVGNKYNLSESVVSNYYNEVNKIMQEVEKNTKL